MSVSTPRNHGGNSRPRGGNSGEVVTCVTACGVVTAPKVGTLEPAENGHSYYVTTRHHLNDTSHIHTRIKGFSEAPQVVGGNTSLCPSLLHRLSTYARHPAAVLARTPDGGGRITLPDRVAEVSPRYWQALEAGR